MKINRKEIVEFFAAIFLIILGCLTYLNILDHLVFPILSYFLIVATVFLVNPSPVSPNVLFGCFVLLYVITFPSSIILLNSSHGLDMLAINISFGSGIFYHGFFIAGSLCVRKPSNKMGAISISRFELTLINNKSVSYLILSMIVVVFFGFYCYAIYYAGMSNATSKSEIGGFGFSQFVFYVGLMVLYLSLFVVPRVITRRQWVLRGGSIAAIFILFFLFTGERDILVRLFIILLVFGFYHEFLRKWQALTIIIAGIFLQPAMQAVKGLLVFGAGDYSAGLASVFTGEFLSQGRNFYNIIVYSDRMADVYDSMIVNDILRFLYVENNSSSSRFGNEVLGRSDGVGVGFSLLGQIYYSAGIESIIVFGWGSGFFLQKLYLASFSSKTYMYIYGMVVFGFAYSLRADVANLLSNIFKVSVAPVLFLAVVFFILNYISVEGKSRRKIPNA